MKKFEYDTLLMSGTWYLWKAGKKRAFVACPSCGGVAMVDLDDIEEDGKVLGGFSCRKRGCGFKDEALLLDWNTRP